MVLEGERWAAQADYDLSVAQLLYQQEVYRYCVFFCHLALEKRLKAMIVEYADVAEPPRIHNLIDLADIVGIDLPNEYEMFLGSLSKQSVLARYPQSLDEYTEDIATPTLSRTMEVYEWLNSMIAS